MKHYIDGEFTLEELEGIKKLMERQNTPLKMTSQRVTYVTSEVVLDVECDMSGSCVISRAYAPVIEVGDRVRVKSDLTYYCSFSGQEATVKEIENEEAFIVNDINDSFGQIAYVRDLELIKKAR